jgi:hypothetical protein
VLRFIDYSSVLYVVHIVMLYTSSDVNFAIELPHSAVWLFHSSEPPSIQLDQ